MTDQEFDSFLESALAELKAKQDYLTHEFGLGRYERFFIDYEKEELQFLSNDQVIISFVITAVGSHVAAKESWQWSWANASLPEKVRAEATGVRQLFDLTGYDIFHQPAVAIDESMAWEFVALSCKVLGSLGAYSVPQRNLRAFVLLDGLAASS